MKKNRHEAKVVVVQERHRQIERVEIEAAHILARYFNCEVFLIPSNNGYKTKTPDIEMNGRLWELKSPIGDSKKYTIKRQLRKGKRQSRNIIIDTRKTPLDDTFIVNELIKVITNKDARVTSLVVINKKQEVYLLK